MPPATRQPIVPVLPRAPGAWGGETVRARPRASAVPNPTGGILLFDNLVGERKQRRGYLNAKRPRSLEVDDEFEPS
jgi:hypothetical protein